MARSTLARGSRASGIPEPAVNMVLSLALLPPRTTTYVTETCSVSVAGFVSLKDQGKHSALPEHM